MNIKYCLNCNKKIIKKETESLSYWNRKKFCCHNCAFINAKDKPSRSPNTTFKNGVRGYWAGKKRPSPTFETKNKMSLSRKKILTTDVRKKMSQLRGKKHPNWRGGNSSIIQII